ncbi:hypothetical protein [Mameliella sp.]|uniref:hypothetical protein n=1 Tax=Mameliella sp. TaxID=1924940 RepID=UPI003C7E998D
MNIVKQFTKFTEEAEKRGAYFVNRMRLPEWAGYPLGFLTQALVAVAIVCIVWYLFLFLIFTFGEALLLAIGQIVTPFF